MKEKTGFFLTGLAWIFADQLTKALISSRLPLNSTIPVIQDFFHITYIQNAGASFGLFQNKTLAFVFLTAAVLAVLFWLLWKEKPSLGTSLILGTVAGGAVGNLMDRIRIGKVIDFIDFRGIWPYIFNVADIAVVCGGILLAWVFIRQELRLSAKPAKEGKNRD
ncbi:MAG: signal peptidase II [Peptococcaceae bacterium]|nr:signal peptidase II [Peptococcaceae bacterium]